MCVVASFARTTRQIEFAYSEEMSPAVRSPNLDQTLVDI